MIKHSPEWLNHIAEIYARGVQRRPILDINKQKFIDSLRASANCPYIPGKSFYYDDSNFFEIYPEVIARLDDEGYYVTGYHPWDSTKDHVERLSSSRVKKMLKFYGWLDDNGDLKPVEYKTNSTGFRDMHFTDEPGILCFGDSMTFGTGLNIEDTWPKQLQKITGQKTWNLGVSGLSLEPAVAYLCTYLEEDLPNVTGIIVQEAPLGMTFKARYAPNDDLFHFSTWHSKHITENVDDQQKSQIINDAVDTSFFQKTMLHKLLELYAASKNVPFVRVNINDIKPTDWARDLKHKGAKSQHGIAELVKERFFAK